MRKTRDLFKKIRDIKGTFLAKLCLIKDRNGRDLTEAEDIKKRWQEYTEELYKKDLQGPDNYDGVITHLESDILFAFLYFFSMGMLLIPVFCTTSHTSIHSSSGSLSIRSSPINLFLTSTV